AALLGRLGRVLGRGIEAPVAEDAVAHRVRRARLAVELGVSAGRPAGRGVVREGGPLLVAPRLDARPDVAAFTGVALRAAARLVSGAADHLGLPAEHHRLLGAQVRWRRPTAFGDV